MKRYMNASLLYALLAMVGGVFYREFTKFNGFTARTALGVVHTHYFLLGMVFFLLLLLLEKSFSFTGAKTKRALTTYHRPEHDRRHARRPRYSAGTGHGAFRRDDRGDLRRRRYRPHPAGRKHGNAAPANQARGF